MLVRQSVVQVHPFRWPNGIARLVTQFVYVCGGFRQLMTSPMSFAQTPMLSVPKMYNMNMWYCLCYHALLVTACYCPCFTIRLQIIRPCALDTCIRSQHKCLSTCNWLSLNRCHGNLHRTTSGIFADWGIIMNHDPVESRFFLGPLGNPASNTAWRSLPWEVIALWT